MSSQINILLARQRASLLRSIGELHRSLEDDDNWRALAALESVGEAAGGVPGYAWAARREELSAALAENPIYCVCKDLERSLAVVVQHMEQPGSSPRDRDFGSVVPQMSDLSPDAGTQQPVRSASIAERIETLAIPTIMPEADRPAAIQADMVPEIAKTILANVQLQSTPLAAAAERVIEPPVSEPPSAEPLPLEMPNALQVTEEAHGPDAEAPEETDGLTASVQDESPAEIQNCGQQPDAHEQKSPDEASAVAGDRADGEPASVVHAEQAECMVQPVSAEPGMEDLPHVDDACPLEDLAVAAADDEADLPGGTVPIDATAENVSDVEAPAVPAEQDTDEDATVEGAPLDVEAAVAELNLDSADFEAEVSIVPRRQMDAAERDTEAPDSIADCDHETLEQRLQRLDRLSQNLIAAAPSARDGTAKTPEDPSRENKWLEMIRARRAKAASEPRSMPAMAPLQETARPPEPVLDEDMVFGGEGDVEAEVKIVHRKHTNTGASHSHRQDDVNTASARPSRPVREHVIELVAGFGGGVEEASVEIVRHSTTKSRNDDRISHGAAGAGPASPEDAAKRFIKTLTGE